MDPELRFWHQACRFFKHNPAHHTAANPVNGTEETKIRVAGMRLALFQHQLPAVYWCFQQEYKVGGGYVADDMGMGKVYS